MIFGKQYSTKTLPVEAMAGCWNGQCFVVLIERELQQSRMQLIRGEFNASLVSSLDAVSFSTEYNYYQYVDALVMMVNIKLVGYNQHQHVDILNYQVNVVMVHYNNFRVRDVVG